MKRTVSLSIFRFLSGSSYDINVIDMLDERISFYAKLYGVKKISSSSGSAIYPGEFLIRLVKLDIIVLSKEEKNELLISNNPEHFFEKRIATKMFDISDQKIVNITFNKSNC